MQMSRICVQSAEVISTWTEASENKYASQEELSKAVQEWMKILNDAVMKASGNKYDGRLNLGDALNPFAVGLDLAHFAPARTTMKNFKEY